MSDRDDPGRVSSFCHDGGCVQVTPLAGDRVAVGSTERPAERVWFTAAEWAPFLAGVKAGEFDLTSPLSEEPPLGRPGGDHAMNQADRDLLREVSGFLAEHYRGPGVDEMRARIDQRLNADDLDTRFARLREREAPAVKAQRYAEMFVRGAPSRGAPAPAEPDGETETHTEYQAVGGCPNGGQGEGYRGDSLRAARISADQLARHDYTGVRVETRTVTTTRTTTAWEEQR